MNYKWIEELSQQAQELGFYGDFPYIGDKFSMNVIKYYSEYPELFDFLEVFEAGVKQGHKADGWLEPDGAKMSNKDNYASIDRHKASAMNGIKLDQSGYDHRLHAAWRLLTSYLRDKRGIVHPEDIKTTREWVIDDTNCLTLEENYERNKGREYTKKGDV
jgi:hypothetical protein